MQNQTILQKLSDIREKCRSLSSQKDIFRDGIIKIKIEDLDWLIGTIEQQQRKIERLKDGDRFRLKMLQKQEKDLMKVCEERDRLKQQLQQAQERIEELEYLEAAVQSSPYEDYFWKKIQEMKASEETK
jgi:chromosome segregation ATPase